MSALSIDSLELDPAAYSAARSGRRGEAIELRRDRRVQLGDLVLVEFENTATLLYQAQEMLYVERVTDPGAAAAEVAAYDRLLPTRASVAATMLIEIEDQSKVRAELTRLDGLHESIRLEVADLAVAARDIPPPDEGPSAHTVSVHFLGFELSAAVVAALGDGAPARLVADHPAYHAEAQLSPALVGLLLRDMQAS